MLEQCCSLAISLLDCKFQHMQWGGGGGLWTPETLRKKQKQNLLWVATNVYITQGILEEYATHITLNSIVITDGLNSM